MNSENSQLIEKFFDQRDRDAGTNVFGYVAMANFDQATAALTPTVRELFTAALFERVAEFCRSCDQAIQWNESKSVLLIRDIAKASQLELATAKLMRIFENPITVLDESIKPDVRAVFVIPSKAQTNTETLVHAAEQALPKTSQLAPTLRIKLGKQEQQRTTIPSSDLHAALIAGEFELLGAPIQHASFGSTVGIDVYLQWHSHKHGSLSPAEYLETVDDPMLLRELSWTLIKQAAAFLRAAPDFKSVALALPVSILLDDELLDILQETWSFYDLPLNTLRLKLKPPVETDNQGLAAVCQAFQDKGIQICLDDFGNTGISLADIIRFPADQISIAADLYTNRDSSRKTDQVFAHIVNLAKSLEMQVIVPTEFKSRDELAERGVQEIVSIVHQPTRELIPSKQL